MDDVKAVERCIEIATAAGQAGEQPFGSIVVRGDEIVGEGENCVARTLDPTAHAEIIAIRRACQSLGRIDLSDCVLYTSGEPCWMCSTAIRITGITRVTFAAPSAPGGPGGYSSPYPILLDTTSTRFGPPPEVVPGFLSDRSQAMKVLLDFD